MALSTTISKDNSNSLEQEILNITSTPYAFFVLTGIVDPYIFHWTTFLPKHEFTIFFIEDAINEESIIPFEKVYPMQGIESSPRRYIVHLDSKVLNDKGYGGMNFVKGWISAWEKAMYFLIELKPTYEYMWFMEDDVLVLLPEAFLNIHKQLVEGNFDMVGNYYLSGDPINMTNGWYNWRHVNTIQKVYSPPFYYGMASSLAISRILLQKISRFQRRVGRFEFLEVFFYTVAKKENLKIFSPTEFQEIEWRKFHNCSKVIKFPGFWYHPVKLQSRFINFCISNHFWRSDIGNFHTPNLISS